MLSIDPADDAVHGRREGGFFRVYCGHRRLMPRYITAVAIDELTTCPRPACHGLFRQDALAGCSERRGLPAVERGAGRDDREFGNLRLHEPPSAGEDPGVGSGSLPQAFCRVDTCVDECREPAAAGHSGRFVCVQRMEPTGAPASHDRDIHRIPHHGQWLSRHPMGPNPLSVSLDRFHEMALDRIDLVAFLAFLGTVVGVSLYASRKEETTADYFLAGRNLPWWLIGISLIASNISSEHFIGMSGEGFQTGLAIACFEWVAAIALVFVALVLLPRFLQAGIYTLPEYLEFRYGPVPRVIMAAYLMIVYVVVGLAGILYAGSLALTSIFGLDLAAGVWAIGLLAGGYTIYGGLKAVVWSDMLQGVALLGGGVLLFFLTMNAVGGFGAFLAANEDRLHLMLPTDHPTLPWTIYLMGIWVPNIAYWGLNQFISQRALAARSLAEGQKGVIFAAFLKLAIPFLIVMPGIAAYQLYGSEIAIGDQAYPELMTRLLPTGLRGVMFAALFGAVMSSLDSMLNSASTIFTLDIYSRHVVKEELEPHRAIRIGRIATGVFVVIGCLLAPHLASVGGIYEYMQRVWNFIWPGILAVFLMGMLLPKAPPRAATVALLISPAAYGLLTLVLDAFFDSQAYLNAAAGAFVLSCLVLAVWSRLCPLDAARPLPQSDALDLEPAPSARWAGALVVVLTVSLYAVFW